MILLILTSNLLNINNYHFKCHIFFRWLWWMWVWLRSWLWGPAVSLHHCLAAFFSADELKGDNMYSCEKCGKLRNGVKYSKVVHLPEVLIIHLKRFRHEYMFSSKISQYVSFPLHGLDLTPFLHKGQFGSKTFIELLLQTTVRLNKYLAALLIY